MAEAIASLKMLVRFIILLTSWPIVRAGHFELLSHVDHDLIVLDLHKPEHGTPGQEGVQGLNKFIKQNSLRLDKPPN